MTTHKKEIIMQCLHDNLPDILDAIKNNTSKYSLAIMEHPEYIEEIKIQYYSQCAEEMKNVLLMTFINVTVEDINVFFDDIHDVQELIDELCRL